MAIRYISDLHLGDQKVMEDERPQFNSLDEMHDFILNAWNAEVDPEDTVYIVGDAAYAYTPEVVDVLQRLNGHLHLIIGNHDIVENIPSGIFETMQHYLYIKDDNIEVALSHFPYHRWDRMTFGTAHIFGHVHVATMVKQNAYNAWCVACGYVPRTLDWYRKRDRYDKYAYRSLMSRYNHMERTWPAL